MANSDSTVNHDEGMTLTTLIAEFLASRRLLCATGEIEPVTVEYYRYQLEPLRSTAGRRLADRLRPETIEGITWTYHVVRAAKCLYRWAEREGHVTRNVFARMKTPACGSRTRVLLPGEVRDLYRCSTRAFARFLFAQLHTIARPGELRRLTWSQVDLKNRVLKLKKFKSKKQRKDGLALRLIPLDEPLTQWLTKERFRRRPAPGDHVFLNERYGLPWTQNGLRCAMRAARRKAGLEEDETGERIVCYSLRHTGATEAVRDGVEPTELADIMGHTSISMTRRYLHRSAADLVAVVDRRKKGKAHAEQPG